MRRSLAFAFALTPVLVFSSYAQGIQLSFGATGGVPISNSTSGLFQESRPYLIGPSVEARFTDHFAVEFDALYRRLGTTTPFTALSGSSLPYSSFLDRSRGNSWEFPLLGKYYLTGRDNKFQPFLSTGWAFRKVWINSDTTFFNNDGTQDVTSSSRTSDTGVGAVFGGGVRVGYNRFSFTPEFRYTRWGGMNYPVTRDQVDFLVGIRF